MPASTADKTQVPRESKDGRPSAGGGQPAAAPPTTDAAGRRAAVLARRDQTFQTLQAGYPAAGAAELLLLRLASADAACVAELQQCELALADSLKEALHTEPDDAFAMLRLLREFGHTTAVLRSRVQMSLTAATTIMATSRLVRAQEPKGGK